jgi:hypothetical protein
MPGARRRANMLAATLLAVSPAAGRSAAQAPAEEARERAQILANELEEDRLNRAAAPQSRCDGARGGNGPEICIRLLGGGPVGKWQRVRIAVRWRNLPAGAGLAVRLQRDVPAGERAWLQGATGPVMLSPLAVSGNGSRVLDWDASQTGCAPADAPTWCPTEIGRYRLNAMVFDRADFALLGWPDPNPPRAIVQGNSPGFAIAGEPDWNELGRAMEQRARLSLNARHADRQNAPLRPLGGITHEESGYCGRFAPPVPLEGEIIVCAAPETVSAAGFRVEPNRLEVTGAVRQAAGTIDQVAAEAAARATGEQPYLPRVRFRHQPSMSDAGFPGGDPSAFLIWSRANPLATTYLSDDVMAVRYRIEEGGYWLFVLSEIMAGGQDNAPGRFADKVLVRVDHRARACVVEAVPYRGTDFRHDLETGRIACP